MAVVKVVCSDCGGPVSLTDKFCPSCGARLKEGEPGEKAVTGRQASGGRRCAACGFVNTGEGATCESCGARLPGSGSEAAIAAGPAVEAPGLPKAAIKAKKKPVAPERTGSGKSGVNPWQIVSGVAVLGLVVFLVYNEATKDQPKPKTPPPQSSQTQLPPTPVDITPLETAAAASPGDPTAALRLANALQDNGQYEKSIEAYKKYLVLRPDDPNALVDMGICYYQLALTDSARSHSLFALALNEMETAYNKAPTFQPAAFNLGIVNLHIGNLKASNTWFERAVEIDRNSELGKKAVTLIQKHTFPE